MIRLGWLHLVALGMAPALAGCPANTCFLTVNGRCTWSSCPEGADYDTARKTCNCQAGRIALGGGCLTLEAANQYCGKGAHFENNGCARNVCPPGLAIDEDTGYCLTPQQSTQVASNMGVQVGHNQKLGCPPGEQLVVEGQQAACVPLNQTCGRDEVWDGRACRKALQCPPGSAFDAKAGGCVRFTTGNEASAYTVDLPTWVRAAYGPMGGEGTPSFCGVFNKHPLAFGVRAGASQRVRVSVQVQAPEQQVARTTVTSLAVFESSGQSVPAKGAAQVQQAAEATLASLVAGGGKANALTATTTVSCQVVNSSKPTAVTVTGGA